MSQVCIVSYGMGNIRSVSNALESLGASVRIAQKPAELEGADRVILPGVGAFGDAMALLHRGGWVPALNEVAQVRKRPFLGICLGMQLLASRGLEFGDHPGLGWVEGAVTKLEVGAGTRIPHIGWNDVETSRPDGLLKGLKLPASFYFVHSFAMVPTDAGWVSGTTSYGGSAFVSVIERDNVMATQFHPEKSQKAGLALLKNFLSV